MKKIIQLIASIFIVISMTACSGKQPTNDTSTDVYKRQVDPR